MEPSRASKYLNKLKGWAHHEGLVQVEVPEARDEFLPVPRSVPPEAQATVNKLFDDWFAWERRLIRANLTPVELFIRTQERKLKEQELEIYRRFVNEQTFGLFKVESVDPGRGMELKRLTDGRAFDVIEVAASQEAEGDECMIARLIPFEDHWVIASLAGAYPAGASYAFERSLAAFPKKDKARNPEFKPRHFLSLLVPKVDWHEQGLPRVKARISMMLQRWKVSDLTVSKLEKDILEAHEKRAPNTPFFQAVLSRCPSSHDAEEITELLTAFWNLTIPESVDKPGPKESMLFGDLSRVVIARLRRDDVTDEAEARAKAQEIMRQWLKEPQKELEGRAPEQVILEERKATGNPRTDFLFSIIPSEVKIGPEEDEGTRLADQGIRLLVEKKATEALALFEKAYPLMKTHPSNFRLLGNMATAHVLLGDREKAIELLRASLRANPDYNLARSNLHRLETLTPEQFLRKHKSGFYQNMNVVKEDEEPRRG